MKEINRLEILEKVASGRLTQVAASRLLGLSRRQVIRLNKRYAQDGAQALISKRRGKASNNRLPVELKNSSIALVKAYYSDFGPTFAQEKLTEKHGLSLSVETLRQWMTEAGLWKGKQRKAAPIHQMRERRSCLGELVQIDGSPHDWFEGRGDRCCLLVFIDDATSKLMALKFVSEECTQGYFDATQQYLLTHGKPIALYSDRHGIFRVNAKEAITGTGETQFGRAMRELGIEIIHANSPQAKGRVERANSTLQNRLVKEMRLRGLSDIASANAFLPEFMDDYNTRFSKPPSSSTDIHRKELPTQEELALILCQKQVRTITKNLEVHHNNKIYQIQPKTQGYTMRGSKVTVAENLGQITLLYKGAKLPYKVFDKQNRPPAIITAKQLNRHMDTLKASHKPRPDHPWRKGTLTSTA